jgi:hypothetical protein
MTLPVWMTESLLSGLQVLKHRAHNNFLKITKLTKQKQSTMSQDNTPSKKEAPPKNETTSMSK